MTDEYTRDVFFEDASEGDSSPTLTSEPFERADFAKYAGASGDFNPIHYAEPFAEDAGFDSVFGQGMLAAGFLSHLAADWVGLENMDSFHTRFVSQFWPGDTLTASGEITDVEAETNRITATLVVENRDDVTVIDGRLTATLPSRE